jgi:hypothetical protein
MVVASAQKHPYLEFTVRSTPHQPLVCHLAFLITRSSKIWRLLRIVLSRGILWPFRKAPLHRLVQETWGKSSRACIPKILISPQNKPCLQVSIGEPLCLELSYFSSHETLDASRNFTLGVGVLGAVGIFGSASVLFAPAGWMVVRHDDDDGYYFWSFVAVSGCGISGWSIEGF